MNPKFPISDSIPIWMDPLQLSEIKNTLIKILDAADFTYGALNVEMYFTKDNRLFIIEINPRQGGAGLPSFVFRHCGIDMYKLLVTTAVNDDQYFNSLKQYNRKCHYISQHLVFAYSSGIYKGISCSPDIQEFVTNIEEYILYGEKVEECTNGTEYLATVYLEFDSYELQHKYCENFEQYIKPIIE